MNAQYSFETIYSSDNEANEQNDQNHSFNISTFLLQRDQNLITQNHALRIYFCKVKLDSEWSQLGGSLATLFRFEVIRNSESQSLELIWFLIVATSF